MANNQQYRARVYADNSSTIGSLDYQNGVRETRRSVSYIAQPPPTLQINYSHPQVQQQQQQQQQQQYTAYTGRTSPVPVQPARVPSPAALIYPSHSQQPYVVYQEERRPSEVPEPSGFFTTTIPRGSTLELPQNAEPVVVGQSGAQSDRYFSASNQISGTTSASASITVPKVIPGRVDNYTDAAASAVIPAVGFSVGNVIDQPVIIRTAADVHRDETSTAAAQESPESINGGQTAIRQNGDAVTATKSTGGRQQRAKTPVPKAKKQATPGKSNNVKTKITKETAQILYEDKASEAHGQSTRRGSTKQGTSKSQQESKHTLVNDIFVEQVNAARQAQKGSKDQNQQKKLKSAEKKSEARKQKAIQVGAGHVNSSGEQETVRTADKDLNPVNKKRKPRKTSIHTQTETPRMENPILMNTAEVQTETLPVTSGNADSGNEEQRNTIDVGHVGQDHVVWTSKGTQIVSDISKAKEEEADGGHSTDNEEGSESSSGASVVSKDTELMMNQPRENTLYARIIKPRGASSIILEHSVIAETPEEPPALPEKTNKAFETDIPENDQSRIKINGGVAAPSEVEVANELDGERVDNPMYQDNDSSYATLPAAAVQTDPPENIEVPSEENTEPESYRILRVAAEKGEVDVYANISESKDSSAAPVAAGTAEVVTMVPSETESRTTGQLPAELDHGNGLEVADVEMKSPKTSAPTLPSGFVLNDSLNVYFHCCDITKMKTYVIVSAADGKLKHEHGVAHAIAKAGGKDLEKDSKKYVKKNGAVAVGDVVSTRPGKLLCAHVFHAAGPRYKDYDDKNECKAKLRQTYDKIFQTCMLHRVPSIAIPLISTGRFGVPYQFVASCMYESVLAAAINHENSKYPKEVHFVNLESAVILPVAVNLATAPAEISGRKVKVTPLDKVEVRDVLRERVIHRKSSSSSSSSSLKLKKVKEVKKPNDARKSSKSNESAEKKR